MKIFAGGANRFELPWNNQRKVVARAKSGLYCPPLEVNAGVQIIAWFSGPIADRVYKIQSEISGDELKSMRRGRFHRMASKMSPTTYSCGTVFERQASLRKPSAKYRIRRNNSANKTRSNAA